MPRIALSCAGFVLLASACRFNSNDGGSHFLCSDGVCPAGEHCVAGACTTGPDDAATDAPPDTPVDVAPVAALTCADPGIFTGGSIDGSTTTRTNQVTAACSAEVMNGPDAVYRITVASGAQLHISITGDYAVAAYAIAPCMDTPATPACEGNVAAFAGAPIVVTAPVSGDQFVVVDGALPLESGSYTLTVVVN